MILFIRHGESTSNNGENDCVDAPLSDLGIKQSQSINFEKYNIDCVICSPLCRTYSTYQYSSINKNIEFKISELCRERIFAERDIMNGEKLEIETDEQFWIRISKFRDYINILQKKYKTIIIFGHSYFFSVWNGGRNMQNCEIRHITQF